jgi:hypothetical protein
MEIGPGFGIQVQRNFAAAETKRYLFEMIKQPNALCEFPNGYPAKTHTPVAFSLVELRRKALFRL